MQRGHLPSVDCDVSFTVRGYVKQFEKMYSNKVFMLVVLGMGVQSMYGAGVWGFVIKVSRPGLQNRFP